MAKRRAARHPTLCKGFREIRTSPSKQGTRSTRIPRAAAVQWVANPIHHGVRATGRTDRFPAQHYFSMMSSMRTVKYGALRNVDSSNAPFTTGSTVSPWYTVVIVEKSMKERSTG